MVTAIASDFLAPMCQQSRSCERRGTAACIASSMNATTIHRLTARLSRRVMLTQLDYPGERCTYGIDSAA